ncbi:response regulator, partial [Klebsiella pneumoniae]|uniref:response regulator n=1 Tax=Klebsiella pneumoniae TaxID=573 RepID=UPI0027313D8A
RFVMRILLVEDDATLNQVVSRSLADQGHHVDVAATAEQARWLWRVQGFDAVLLDLSLPDGSGFDLLSRWRRADATTPVIVITARTALEDRLAGLDGGADDFVMKPFAISELLSRIHAVV